MNSATTGPLEYCDLVMKGGITSGVVYPLAITELSQKYLFKNIGGTSAGAVAAAVTAGAEFGRRTGNKSAYASLAELPDQLGKNNLLLNLFQPSGAAVRAFRVALAALKAKSVFGRIFNALVSLLYQFWSWAIVGIFLGSALPLVLYLICHGPGWAYVVLGSLWVLVICAITILVVAAHDALKATTANGFGFCSGVDPKSKNGPPLTNWLHERIQLAAGKDLSNPLTFGDLWNAPSRSGEPDLPGPTINLQVVTTNLTMGCPFTIPFQAYAFYFDENEFRALFPESIVQHLISHSPNKPNETVTSRSGVRLYRLPDGRDLPIVVAARMSLSFPLLLSAVPLYLPDHPHKLIVEAPEADQAVTEEPKKETQINADRCWFSDGGICSNFPMHFFDSPLPRWPTFGIDLEPRRGPKPASIQDMVWFPPRPGSGSQLTLSNFDQGSNWNRLVGFVSAIVDTMQNWRDALQTVAAGYRDRIVHIQLFTDYGEGGLNLNMPTELITNLSKRGQVAGQIIIKDFNFPSHIFARYRITMSALQTYLNSLGNAWLKPLPQDALGNEYIAGTQDPPSYMPGSPNLRKVMFHGLQHLVGLAEGWQAQLRPNQSFGKDRAPLPQPTLRNQPKF